MRDRTEVGAFEADIAQYPSDLTVLPIRAERALATTTWLLSSTSRGAMPYQDDACYLDTALRLRNAFVTRMTPKRLVSSSSTSCASVAASNAPARSGSVLGRDWFSPRLITKRVGKRALARALSCHGPREGVGNALAHFFLSTGAP